MAAEENEACSRTKDITDCSVCLRMLKEPKALPCIHTFCLECLEMLCDSKSPDMEAACPLCRKLFVIPRGGVKNLPNNFFINKFIKAMESTSATERQDDEKTCNKCSVSDEEIPATCYCIECDQHICDRCYKVHKRSGYSRSHHVRHDDGSTGSIKRLKLSVGYCDEHPNERNRLFCNDCKTVTCHLCFVDKHSEHKWTDVNIASLELNEQLQENENKLSICAARKRERIERQEKQTSSFRDKVAGTKKEISQKYDQIIELTESRKRRLVKELDAFAVKRQKEEETRTYLLERQLVVTERCMKECQTMIRRGNAHDMYATVQDLDARAEEILNTEDEPDCHQLRGDEVVFKPAIVTSDSVKNLIGELVVKDENGNENENIDFPTFFDHFKILNVQHVENATGITVLDNRMYVVRESETQEVDVYISESFTFRYSIPILGSVRLQGIISCPHYNCIYVNDATQNIIYRHDVLNNETTNWLVRGECQAMSVSKSNSVLIASSQDKLIQEYTTHGSLIGEIWLDDSMGYPLSCVQLSTGNFAVGQIGDLHRVCIVDASGRIIERHAFEYPELGWDKQTGPYHMVVDSYDNLVIADCDNNRVQLFSPELNYSGDMILPGVQLDEPYLLHFDELNQRLYLLEWSSDRLFQFGPAY